MAKVVKIQRDQLSSGNVLCTLSISIEEAFDGAQIVLNIFGRRLQIKLPAGLSPGSRIRLSGEGEHSMLGEIGDLYLMIEIAEHPIYRIQGSNLYCKIPLSRETKENKIEVPLMDGNTVKIDLPPVILNEHQVWLSQQGMSIARSDSRGDLYVDITIAAPSDQEKFVATMQKWCADRKKALESRTIAPPTAVSTAEKPSTVSADTAPRDAQVAIEREFKNVFFNKASEERERIISLWMTKRKCTRYEAMSFAVEDWHGGQRTWR